MLIESPTEAQAAKPKIKKKEIKFKL